jgi:hypothetical protein
MHLQLQGARERLMWQTPLARELLQCCHACAPGPVFSWLRRSVAHVAEAMALSRTRQSQPQFEG